MLFLSKVVDPNVIFEQYRKIFTRLFLHLLLSQETNPFIQLKIVTPLFIDTKIFLLLDVKKQFYFLHYKKHLYIRTPLFLYGFHIIDFVFSNSDINLTNPLYTFYLNAITEELACPCFSNISQSCIYNSNILKRNLL